MNTPRPLAHEAIYEAVQKALAREPRGHLLDVPAGHGALARRLIDDGFDVACGDLYPEIFELSQVPICSCDLDERLPYADSAFEAVVCVEGLEHIENPSNAIREFSRLLKSGGCLVVSVPNILNIEERLKWLIHGYTSHFKPLSREALEQIDTSYQGKEEIALHVNPIGYSEVRYLLEKFGFEVERVYIDKSKRHNWAYWPVVSTIRLFGKMNSAARRRERWTDELNSNEVLTGGNTLIFKARRT
jgi:SAM-dependent methyltransferase